MLLGEFHCNWNRQQIVDIESLEYCSSLQTPVEIMMTEIGKTQ